MPKLYEIWPGRLWTRGRTNSLSGEDREQIVAAARGALLVVSLCPRPDREWEKVAGVTYWHRPIPDGKTIPPTVEGLADEIAEQDRPTLLYCNGGRNRSPYMAALVLTRIAGMSGEQAAGHVCRIRPGALANELFVAYLRLLPPARLGPCIAGGLA